jgi:phage terminase large subunit GpA-like protein
MSKCQVCGNQYDKSFDVVMAGQSHTFDSFECAIHALAPTCAHCSCRIVGHGVEVAGRYYCCANCARMSGAGGARDRA